MNIKKFKKVFYFLTDYDTIKYIFFSEETMKDTKDNKPQEQQEKINFQSLRKCVFDDYCHSDNCQCNFDLLYDEFIRI